MIASLTASDRSGQRAINSTRSGSCGLVRATGVLSRVRASSEICVFDSVSAGCSGPAGPIGNGVLDSGSGGEGSIFACEGLWLSACCTKHIAKSFGSAHTSSVPLADSAFDPFSTRPWIIRQPFSGTPNVVRGPVRIDTDGQTQPITVSHDRRALFEGTPVLSKAEFPQTSVPVEPWASSSPEGDTDVPGLQCPDSTVMEGFQNYQPRSSAIQ